jgi:hypothetical protein
MLNRSTEFHPDPTRGTDERNRYTIFELILRHIITYPSSQHRNAQADPVYNLLIVPEHRIKCGPATEYQ